METRLRAALSLKFNILVVFSLGFTRIPLKIYRNTVRYELSDDCQDGFFLRTRQSPAFRKMRPGKRKNGITN